MSSRITVNQLGDKVWKNEKGQRHREDGPAFEARGIKTWYLNDKRHRKDGPAIEYANGSKEWFLNGLRHREDGPAIEWWDGAKYYYLNGKEYTEAEFLLLSPP